MFVWLCDTYIVGPSARASSQEPDEHERNELCTMCVQAVATQRNCHYCYWVCWVCVSGDGDAARAIRRNCFSGLFLG